MALYSKAWREANPERAAAATRRNQERQKALRPERRAAKARTFVERYRDDAEFRAAHKAKSREYAASHPDVIAAKTARRKQGYKALNHDPIVYFIRSYLTGLIKIGTTCNLAMRVSQLRNNHPGRMAIVGVIDGGQKLEAAIHVIFDGSRFDGEWFTETPALVEYVKQNARDTHPDLGGVSLAPGEGHGRGRKKT